MGKRTTRTQSQERAVTAPQLPDVARQPYQQYYTDLYEFQRNAPDLTVSPTSLQEQAWENASNMTGGNYTKAYDMIDRVTSQTQPSVGYMKALESQDALAATGEPASQIDLESIRNLFGGDPTLVDDIADLEGRKASDYSGDYIDPYLEDVVNAALAEFDDYAGQQQAAYAREGARNNAFGGSRYGIGEGQLMADQARDRLLTDASLRSDAFRFGTEAGAGDANRAAAADQFNAGFDANRAFYNADALNNRADMMGQLGYNAAAFNAGAANNFAMQNLMNRQAVGMRNADAANNFAQFNRGLEFDRQQSNADRIENLYNRRLQAAGMLGELAGAQSADERANIGLQADLGQQQFSLEQFNNLAPYTQMQLLGELLNPGGILNTGTGQVINSSGTSTQTQSGGLLGSILGSLAGGVGTALGRRI